MNKKYKYNQSVVKELCNRYSVSASAVRKALSGERTSEKSEAIKKDYYRAEKAVNELTKTILNNIISS